MNHPVLANLEFRSYTEEEIKFISKRTGNADSFVKRQLRLEAEDGTPLTVDVFAKNVPYTCELKKGAHIALGLLDYSTKDGHVEATTRPDLITLQK